MTVFFPGERAEFQNVTEHNYFAICSIPIVNFYNRMMIQPEQIQYFVLNPFYQRKFLFFIQISTL